MNMENLWNMLQLYLLSGQGSLQNQFLGIGASGLGKNG